MNIKNVILVRSGTIVREYCYFLSDDDEESNCGIRNLNGKSGRNEARAPATASKSESLFGEWPHMCALKKTVDAGRSAQFLCGASLISPGVLLTAAHCV